MLLPLMDGASLPVAHKEQKISSASSLLSAVPSQASKIKKIGPNPQVNFESISVPVVIGACFNHSFLTSIGTWQFGFLDLSLNTSLCGLQLWIEYPRGLVLLLGVWMSHQTVVYVDPWLKPVSTCSCGVASVLKCRDSVCKSLTHNINLDSWRQFVRYGENVTHVCFGTKP